MTVLLAELPFMITLKQTGFAAAFALLCCFGVQAQTSAVGVAHGAFVERGTGKPFVPRGFNYIRPSRPGA